MTITQYFYLDDQVILKYGYGTVIQIIADIMNNFLLTFKNFDFFYLLKLCFMVKAYSIFCYHCLEPCDYETSVKEFIL